MVIVEIITIIIIMILIYKVTYVFRVQYIKHYIPHLFRKHDYIQLSRIWHVMSLNHDNQSHMNSFT